MFVSIIDYGMGNVKSIKNACHFVGLKTEITSNPELIRKSSGIILPGIGAFGKAMSNLKSLKLINLIKTEAQKKQLLGICLGMQLLMTESEEFGQHKGLDLIKGKVLKLKSSKAEKVPHVGWNTISKGIYMYFVHSYYVLPTDKNVVVSTTTYGPNRFCSSLHLDNIFGCQYHPERSGPQGLKIYEEFKNKL